MNQTENNDDRIIPIDEARKGQQRETATEGKQPGDGEQKIDEKKHPEKVDIEEKSIVEALLFATESTLPGKKLVKIAELSGIKPLRTIVEQLNEEYLEQNRPYRIEKIGNGFRLYTRPEFDPWVSELHQSQQQDSLSQAALESLAIIAYRQPITRAEIEDIRGVQSGYILRSLIEKSLIKVVGRSEELGRPLLYGTTSEFFEAFGLSSLKDLPKLDDPDLSGGPE